MAFISVLARWLIAHRYGQILAGVKWVSEVEVLMMIRGLNSKGQASPKVWKSSHQESVELNVMIVMDMDLYRLGERARTVQPCRLS